MSLSTKNVVRTRLKSLWNGVDKRVDVEGILFVRTKKDVVQAEAHGMVLGRPFQLTADSNSDDFIDWANAKIVNYAGTCEERDEEGDLPA